MSLDRVDIEGGFDFSKIEGGAISGGAVAPAVEGGRRRRSRSHSRSRRHRRHHMRGGVTGGVAEVAEVAGGAAEIASAVEGGRRSRRRRSHRRMRGGADVAEVAGGAAEVAPVEGGRRSRRRRSHHRMRGGADIAVADVAGGAAEVAPVEGGRRRSRSRSHSRRRHRSRAMEYMGMAGGVDKVDVAGGVTPVVADTGVVGGEEVEGGKYMHKTSRRWKWRSPATRELSRMKRSLRSRCPRGSKKDTRKKKRNPSGCRRHASPRHKYSKGSPWHRRHSGRSREVLGHKVRRLEHDTSTKKKGALYYVQNGHKVYAGEGLKNWPKAMRDAWRSKA